MLTAELIEGFVNGLLAPHFDGRANTPDFHRELWNLCASKHRFVAIAAPRGFAKSTAVTHCFTLAALLFRDRSFAVIVSDTETQAILFLQDIKKELQDNEPLIDLFGVKRDKDGKVKFIKESETDIIVEMSDGHRFRVMAKGSEQKVRGLKWKNKRPDLIICDDLENDEIVMNQERREKFRRWFYGALVPCRADHGVIRVVGTILHMDSLLERLMPATQLAAMRRKDKLQSTELKEWSAIKTPWVSVKYKAHNRDFTQLLWPDKKTAADLQSIRADYLAQGMPELYSQEYLNEPIDESVAYFRRSDFLPMDKTDKEKLKNFYIAVDLAVSEKERADYTAITVGGVDQHGLLHITNVIRDRLDGREIVDLILRLNKLYNPVAFGVEEGQISKSIMPFLRERMHIENNFPSLYSLKPSTDKLTRARSIQARMRAGGVKFDKDAEWYQIFEDELARFPRDKHDDQVDAFAYLGLMIDKMIEAPTPRELQEEVWEEEWNRSGLKEEGRNATTGY
jgi:predicted phage terminase large subunit-like protein